MTYPEILKLKARLVSKHERNIKAFAAARTRMEESSHAVAEITSHEREYLRQLSPGVFVPTAI